MNWSPAMAWVVGIGVFVAFVVCWFLSQHEECERAKKRNDGPRYP